MPRKEYVYYSPELDEMFCFPIKPELDTVYTLWIEDKLLLKHVYYIGEL